MRFEIKLSKYKLRTRPGVTDHWEVWFYEDDGTTTIYSSSEWKCREDAEQDAFNKMLDGKI